MPLIKVAAASRTSAVAGAIAGAMREEGEDVDVQAIGAGAVNQAMKAVAVARGFLQSTGDGDIGVAPSMQQVEVDGEERTAIRLSVFKR